MVDSVLVPSLSTDDLLKKASFIQSLAAQPRSSIWVSASAGTGKTKVLTDRVLNLLLEGVPPRRILCLTYTKAAANEMTLRLLQRLSRWASLEDGALLQELDKLRGEEPSKSMRLRARQLFINVLHTPGGLNIQTIHSFCQSILQKFPLEAAISPHFEIADPTITKNLLIESIQDLFLFSPHDLGLQKCLDFISKRFSLNTIIERLQSIISKPLALQALQQQGLDATILNLYKDLGVSRTQTWAHYQQNHFKEIPREELLQGCFALEKGGVEDQERARILKCSLQRYEDFIKNFNDYIRVFLTADGRIRARLASKNALAACPELLNILTQEAEKLVQLLTIQKSYFLAHQSEIWMELSLWIFERYTQKKQQQGLLDYDDLITKTYQLLHTPGLAPFILYKLDGGINHILVDEAQDTSPLQWALIAALVEEFFSGQGLLQQIPSLFAVGDFKQSIYSFQGAEPHLFHQMRTHFAQKVQDSGYTWRSLDMQISFRSTSPILQAVDHIFAASHVYQGVMDPSVQHIQHVSFDPLGPGLVEIWPLAPHQNNDHEEDVALKRAEDRLAEMIAAQIRNWFDQGRWLEAKKRPLKPGDILILVQRRNHFIYALIRELKRQKIATSGVDRLDLMSHIAVQDFLALSQFLLLPEDNLALAKVLKTPLVGWNEEMLFRLTQLRSPEESLWSTLRQFHLQEEGWEEAYNYLRALLKRLGFTSPFHLFADILYAQNGMKKFIQRMGISVQEILEEFLNLAQTYENEQEASLQKFLSWCEGISNTIKRDLASSELDEVRIMTVHGAKGLQAPVVILADTTRLPELQDTFVWSPQGYMLANMGRNDEVPLLTSLKNEVRQKALEEYRRLLYVALTRAEEQLYICGWEPHKNFSESCWYHLCYQGLATLALPCEFDFSMLIKDGWKGIGLRFHLSSSGTQQREISSYHSMDQEGTVVLPAFLTEPAPDEMPAERPKIASHVARESTEEIQTEQSILARERGHYIHKLLEILPTLDQTDWVDYAFDLAFDFPSLTDHTEALKQVTILLMDSRFSFLFGPGSYSEVPISGTLDGEIYSVQIDRLVVEDKRVLIIDYKSNREVPLSPQNVSQDYIRQLAIYRQLIQKIYPDKHIETYLLWTHNLVLMHIDYEKDKLYDTFCTNSAA